MSSSMISIVTPTYNEKDSIEHFIASVSNQMKQLDEAFEIVVVDDNSPDGTAKLVTKLKSKYPNITLLQRKGKLGIGSAYFDGFQKARGKYIIGIDADLSPSLDVIPRFIKRLDAGDSMVIGSRYLPQSQIHNMSRFKSDGSRLFNHFVRHLLKLPLTDITHSNRALTKEVLTAIAPQITEKGHPGFFIECSFWVNKKGYPISEVPITFTERKQGQSKLDIKNGLRQAMKTVNRLKGEA